MASHQWWRFRIFNTQNSNGNNASIGIIKMFNVLNGSNLCVGGTPFADSYFNSYGYSLTPDKAFDLVNTTVNDIWATSEAIHSIAFIGYEFQTPVDVRYFSLTTRPDCCVEQTWKNFNFEYSDNGVNWEIQSVYSNNPQVPTPNSTQDFEVYDLSTSIITARPLNLSASPITNSLNGSVIEQRPQMSLLHGGKGVVSGTTVKVPSDIPVARKVRLFEEKSGLLIQEVWSDATGAYVFNGLSDNYYFITAHDHTLEFNGVIQSHVRPEFPV